MIKSICVDTLTALQTNELMAEKGKATRDKWRDYGADIYHFMTQLQELGFFIVLVLGNPGTGKSTGMRTLPHQTNIWYNTDYKDPVWRGGRKEYGTKNNPIEPYHVVPKSYDEIIQHIKTGMEKGAIDPNPIAFVTGHLETYKEGDESRTRLKVLGNMATKFQIEGKQEMVLYSKVLVNGGNREYVLETVNDGFGTARSPMDMFDADRIPNDYNSIIEAIENY